MIVKSARKDEITQEFTSEQIANIKANMPTQTANVMILNQVYSPEETKVGVWREYRTVEGQQVLMEKPVYQKTITGLNIKLNWNAQYATFASTSILISSIDKILSAIAILDDGESPIIVRQRTDAWHLAGIDDNTISKLVISYTKSTDEWEVVG